MSLEYEPASVPHHISVKWLLLTFLNPGTQFVPKYIAGERIADCNPNC